MNGRPLLPLALALALLQQAVLAPSDIPGVRYEHRTTAAPNSIHILVVDPRLVRIDAVRALDDGVGRETVSSMAQRRGAIAAVNAGFFRMGGRYDGEPEGILEIGGQWFSDPSEARGAVGWARGGQVARIGRVTMKWTLQGRGATYRIDGINRPREPGESILYDWAFHRSTLTDPGGLEFQISRNRVAGIRKEGNAAIPMDGFVYSVGPKSDTPLEGLKKNAPVKITYGLRDADDVELSKDWDRMECIVGGMPALFAKRKILFEPDREKMRAGFAEARHPRTAVGLRSDGTWVFVVVDGRQPELSVGMSLKELADAMLSLDCIDALNLDGGGSSTMCYQGKVVNAPSDSGKERPVSDAIVVLNRSGSRPPAATRSSGR